MGKSTPKMDVVQYFMSLWYGFAIGPVDKITRFFVDDKEAWSGSVSESSVIAIQNMDLFGGIRKEGGLFGTVTYLDGKSTQTIPQYLAAKLGLTSATCPAHRGIASVFLSGGVSSVGGTSYGSGASAEVFPESSTVGGLNGAFAGANLSTDKGFYWRANQPNVPAISIEATRSPKVLNPSLAMIGDDANVVHMIYEVMTNKQWGISTPNSAINVSTFDSASQTVFSEGIGISLLWTEQESAEDFIASLLSYIEGVIYVNPRTGLFEIKLIRGGYETDGLFEINPSNATLSGFQRKLWAETINEIVVSWTNPESEESETVTVQDLGNIAMQGSPVSDSKSYPGVRSADLAMQLAARDLRVASSPLMSCRAVVNRNAWDVVPGDVVKLTWPEHGLDGIIMRVGDVNYGKTTDSKITVSLVEDIFGLDAGTYYTPPSSAWENPSNAPSIIDHAQVVTMPWYLLGQMGIDTSSMNEDEVYAGVLGADNGNDTWQYLIMFENGTPTGGTVWQGTETRSPLSRATLAEPLSFATASSTVSIENITIGHGINVDCIALIGYEDVEQEVCVVSAVGATSVTLSRATLDTVPRAWPEGTPIWFIPLDADVIDDTVRVGGQPVTYRLLTTTSTGTLSVDLAPDVEGDLTLRPWLPLRPANCKINGASGVTLEVIGASSLTLTWANRNRLLEDSVILGWEDGNVTPEVGQTTTITVTSPDRSTVIATINGLVGTSYSMPAATFAGFSSAYVKFTSKNPDGLESLQGHEVFVTIEEGYGEDYGFNYGGAI